jgi:hypothetical protein
MDDQGVLNWAADWIQAASKIGEHNLTPRQKDALDLARTIISTNDNHASGGATKHLRDVGRPTPPIKWSNLTNAIRTLPKPPQTGQMRVPGPDRRVDPKAPTVAVRVVPRSGAPSGSGKISRRGTATGPIATPLKIIFIGRTLINIAQASPGDRPHVIASEGGGWAGGIIGGCFGAPLGPLGSFALSAGGSYLCSKFGGWLVPPEKPSAGKPPADRPPVRTPEPKPAPPPPPPPGAVGGYDPTKDPGMGGKPSDIAGATQAGAQRAGGGRSPGGKEDRSSQGLGGGEVTSIPTAEPPTDTPPGSREPQPAQGGGWWCYSAQTQEWYQVPMGPCPPSSSRPPRGPSFADPSVRVPHDTLQRTPGMGDKPAGKPSQPVGPSTSPGPTAQPAGPPTPLGPTSACGPGTSCRCAGGGMGHIPCDKAKGACHCGGG